MRSLFCGNLISQIHLEVQNYVGGEENGATSYRQKTTRQESICQKNGNPRGLVPG